jgi:tryptophan halogenase
MLANWVDDPAGRDRYNASVARQVDDFRDFIRMHYVTERRDSPFWQDVAASHPDAVKDRLAMWQTRMPRPADFAPFPLGLPHLQGQLYTPVLDGLGLLSQTAARAEMAAQPELRDKTRATYASLVGEYAKAANSCLPHRAWLQSLQETAPAGPSYAAAPSA